jgi:hypothetical protein
MDPTGEPKNTIVFTKEYEGQKIQFAGEYKKHLEAYTTDGGKRFPLITAIYQTGDNTARVHLSPGTNGPWGENPFEVDFDQIG